MSDETNHCHTMIGGVQDAGFQQLIGEICRLARWKRDEVESWNLFDLLQFIGAEKRPFRFAEVSRPGMLAARLAGLPDGLVRELCVEIARNRRMDIAPPSTKTVFSIIKEAIPKAYRPKRMSRREKLHLENIQFIRQQRSNRTP